MSSFGYNCRLRLYGWSPDQPFFLPSGLLRAAMAALEFCARRSRTRPYCSRHRAKFRLALTALATARASNQRRCSAARRNGGVGILRKTLAHRDVRMPDLPGAKSGRVLVCTARAIAQISALLAQKI